VEQLERLLTIVILVLLGGAVARGLFADVTWAHVLVAAVFLLLVRPLAGWTAMAGSETDSRERAVIAFFGVRGVGSLYYLAYGLGQASFGQPRSLWAITGLVVVGSVVVHGMTAGPAMAFLDDRRRASLRRAGVERPAP
jgi:sodium/hydrogen antiporter